MVPDLTPERRWRIVLARDRRYDGAFVYAVQSTGIYCRPSCPSRRPRRGQVAFFPLPEEAEQAGFRPCRRCRPGEPAAPDPGVPLVRTVCRLIDAHPDRPASLSALSVQAGVTSHRLLRTFQRAERARIEAVLVATGLMRQMVDQVGLDRAVRVVADVPSALRALKTKFGCSPIQP